DITPLLSLEIPLDKLPETIKKLSEDPGDLVKVTVVND
ncbi:MAG TPA: galactitol-1-phosphate 5-dehydrogenase, partial [Tissierellia bacterium]|nr:galactitol-1-phosphate 5-dehydrogenase [Tissierellia bacterium]